MHAIMVVHKKFVRFYFILLLYDLENDNCHFIFVLCVYNCKQLSNNTNIQYVNSPSTQTALFGAVGGLIGSYISHPLDTIKTCIQTNRNYDNFSIKDFFKGCHLRAGMGMINMFISLYVFELLKT